MPNPSQIRLQQLSGSLSEIGTGITAASAGVALAADDSADVKVLLSKFARALAAIHGSSEMFNQTRGTIVHDDGNVTVKGSKTAGTQTVSVVQADGGDANALAVKLDGGGATAADTKLSLVNQTGTAADSIKMASAAGGIDVDSAGAVDIDAAGLVSIDSSAGAIKVGADDVNQNITIGEDGTRTIQVGASDGTSTVQLYGAAGTLLIDGTGQTVDINSAELDVDASSHIKLDAADDSYFLTADTKKITIGEGEDDANHTMIRVVHDDSTAANEKILIQNKAGTQGDAIRLKAEAGGIWIDTDSTNADALNIDSAGGMDVDVAGAIAVDGASAQIVASGLARVSGGSALVLSGTNNALFMSGGVSFSSDGGMSGPMGEMKFAAADEFPVFRGKSIFSSSTSVVGALNALADSVTASEATLLTGSVTSDLSAGNALALSVVGGTSNDLRPAGRHQLDLFVNGQLLVSGAQSDLGGGHIDYCLDSGQARGARFAFALVPGDSVVVVDKQ